MAQRGVMSTTSDENVAIRYGMSKNSLVFKVVASSFMQRGASLKWLSTAPFEEEYLFPPCTYLKPTGRKQDIVLANEQACTVVEVTPHFGS